MINDLVFVGVPADVVIASEISNDKSVRFSGSKGRIVIETIDEGSPCLCDKCRELLLERESD